MIAPDFDPDGCQSASDRGRLRGQLLHLCEIGKLVSEIVFAIGERIAPHKLTLSIPSPRAYVAVEPGLIHDALKVVIDEVLLEAIEASVVDVHVTADPFLQVWCEGRYALTVKEAGHLWDRAVSRRSSDSHPLELASQIMQAHGGTIDLQPSVHGARYALAFGKRSQSLTA